jgi:hypothetical protein
MFQVRYEGKMHLPVQSREDGEARSSPTLRLRCLCGSALGSPRLSDNSEFSLTKCENVAKSSTKVPDTFLSSPMIA